MKKYIAYFDYLGFRQFIENNDLKEQKRGMSHRWRDIEQALSKEETIIAKSGAAIADLDKAKINCINFSDTVVFWTEDDSLESLREIMEVTYLFNWKTNVFFFPARGSLVHGEIEAPKFEYLSNSKTSYNINSVYGKGLISAYEKAESQDWAGTVLDNSVLEQIKKFSPEIDMYLDKMTIPYIIPYKKGIRKEKEYVFRLVEGTLNKDSLEYRRQTIRDNFENYNKGPLDAGVLQKLNNTLEFLQAVIDPSLEIR